MGIIKALIAAAGGLAIFKQAAQSIAAFEQTVSGLKAVTMATADEMQMLTDQAKELGATTRFSAQQAADGMKMLAQAGFTTNQILAAMPATLDLATSGEMGLAEAANSMATALAGFRLEAGKATRVADALAVAASISNTNVSLMAESMKFVAPIAASMGLSIEEVAAAIGVLSDNGMQGTMAGTELRAAIASLVDPSREAVAILKAYGLTVDDVNPKLSNITSVLQKLQKAGMSATDALQIAGLKGGLGLDALVNSVPKLERFNAELAKGSGRAKEMAGIMGDNLAGDFLKLKSGVDSLFVSIGEAGLKRELRETTQELTNFIGKMNDMVKSGEAAAWADLFRFKLNLLTKEGIENLGLTWALTNDFMKNEGKSTVDDIVDAMWHIPENIRAITQLIGTYFGTWYEFGETTTRGLDNLFFAWGRGLVATFKNVGDEIFDQLKHPLVDLEIFARQQLAKLGDIMKPWLDKKAQKLQDAWQKENASEIVRLKELLDKPDNNFWEKQGKILKQFSSDKSAIFRETMQQLDRVGEAYDEEVTRILDERDANIAAGKDKLDAIDKLKAAYERLKVARQEAMKTAIETAGTPGPKPDAPPENPHFNVQEFESLKKQLQLEEKSIAESYAMRLDLIRRNTKEGSDVRLELERQLNQKVSDEYEKVFKDRSSRILTLQEELRAAVAAGRSGEVQALTDQLQVEEDNLKASLERRKQAILENTSLTEEERAKLLAALQVKYNQVTTDSIVARNKANLKVAADFFGNLSEMAGAFGKKGHKIAKAAAIAQATIKTYEAATSAYAAMAGIPYIGPALGVAAAGAAIAAGMANVAAIKSQEYAGAFEHGGMIPAGKVGLVGETGKPELVRGPAIVTSARDTESLLNNRASPVKVALVINNYTSAEVTTRETDGPEGKILELIIRKVESKLVSGVKGGGSPFSKAIEQTYGMKRGAAA